MPKLATKTRRELSATIVLVIAIVVSLALLTMWAREGEQGVLHSVRGAIATVASPLQRAGAVVSTPFQAIGNGVTNASASTEELLTLQQENQRLQAENIQLQEYKSENERLSELLKISSQYENESVAARVISRSTDSWNRTIVIDKGSSDGMAIGMPVMSGSGLLGQIESVAGNTSVVRLITDTNSGVSVTLQESRAEGIVTGSVDGLLYLEFIPIATEVKLGEGVITSGSGGVYPRGMTVGVVSRIEGEPTDTYHTLIVQPLASEDINEEVIVLTHALSSENSSSSEDADAAAVGDAQDVSAPIDEKKPAEEEEEGESEEADSEEGETQNAEANGGGA